MLWVLIMAKVAVVTGGSSGIGLETAKCLARRGCRVYELSRRDSDVPGIVHISADVSDETSVNAAVNEILRREGRIDILINNAGFGISGAVEFTETADARALMDVNFFGVVNATRAVLGPMREKGGGRILNLSSVAATVPIPFQSYYSVSKAAINSFTMALANEVAPFGISVCAVMPGDIRTGFTRARVKRHEGDDIYGGRIARSVAVMEKDEMEGLPPEKAAEFICRIALKEKVKPLYAIGLKYKFFVWLSGVLPPGLVNKIVGSLYAK
jgi:NAD(P)-dependent dehydrogenase (short-subunit alcohol dehydrogenase family)